MRAFLSGLLFLLLAGCSSLPSHENGDISIRTVQVGETALKVMLYDLKKSPVSQATIRVTNPRGELLNELELNRRIAIFLYPMNESSVFIEATDSEGNTGTRQFFRSQLRQIREMQH